MKFYVFEKLHVIFIQNLTIVDGATKKKLHGRSSLWWFFKFQLDSLWRWLQIVRVIRSFFLGANEPTYCLMVTDYRRPWTMDPQHQKHHKCVAGLWAIERGMGVGVVVWVSSILTHSLFYTGFLRGRCVTPVESVHSCQSLVLPQ